MTDVIVDAFVQNYGIKNLLDDLAVRKLQNTSSDQILCCCLFHDEQNASFSMNTTNGLYRCFACGVSGNLYQFVSLSYNIDYARARSFLFERSGLHETENINDILFLKNITTTLKEDSLKEKIEFPTYTPEQVRVFYEGDDPYHYLQNRGFTENTIKYFECGFTSQWRSYNDETHEFYGQSRVVIPGHDESGNYVGFIGRTPVNDEPKYKYTKGYPKSHTLFNLHRAKEYSKAELILVEGSLDAMNIHQLGLPNVCAILGASLSNHQVNLLTQFTNSITLMFDNDIAGKKATRKAIELLTPRFSTLNFIPLDAFKDPGEIKNQEILETLLKNKRNWVDFQLKEVNLQWQ